MYKDLSEIKRHINLGTTYKKAEITVGQDAFCVAFVLPGGGEQVIATQKRGSKRRSPRVFKNLITTYNFIRKTGFNGEVTILEDPTGRLLKP